jgi:hypothetical protein
LHFEESFLDFRGVNLLNKGWPLPFSFKKGVGE